MKFRREPAQGIDEEREVESLRGMLGDDRKHPSAPLESVYWANQIVNVNRRIDDVTSGKALSLSWAARVAIPGVLSLIFFFIGLHYYFPDQPQPRSSSLTSVVLSLPAEAVDSLYAELAVSEHEASEVYSREPVFDMTKDQISEYWIENDKSGTLIESLGDSQIDALLVAIQSMHNTL